MDTRRRKITCSLTLELNLLPSQVHNPSVGTTADTQNPAQNSQVQANMNTRYRPTADITAPTRRKIKLTPQSKEELEEERELARALALLALPNR